MVKQYRFETQALPAGQDREEAQFSRGVPGLKDIGYFLFNHQPCQGRR